MKLCAFGRTFCKFGRKLCNFGRNKNLVGNKAFLVGRLYISFVKAVHIFKHINFFFSIFTKFL